MTADFRSLPIVNEGIGEELLIRPGMLDFGITLQRDARNWIALGTTKTGLVYRLKGNPPLRLE